MLCVQWFQSLYCFVPKEGTQATQAEAAERL